MATIPSITIANVDAADGLAALEQQFRSQAINFFFSGDPTGYEALTGPQKARECLKAAIRILTRNYRRVQAEQALSVSDPDVT